jgi:DNA segregation ATPase FtsK/SpoIIIE-like protein
VENLPEYNAVAPQSVAPLLVVADEGTNLLNQDGVSEPLRAAVQTARQYGIYLLLAGQSANARVVSTQIRDNFTTRICFRTSPTSSRVVLDDRAAANVMQRGRGFVQLSGRPLTEVQGCWVDKREFLTALGHGGPRQSMPVVVEDNPAQEIRRLHTEGLTNTAIARTVFGHANGHYIQKVKDSLPS